MKINERGIALIKQFEGCSLRGYYCPAGVLTIGYGSTGPHVTPGMRITLNQAEELLRRDLGPREAALAALLGKTPTTANQFAAMGSLLFNIGIKNFQQSAVLRQHKAGNHRSAAAAFKLWNKARVNGKLRVLAGLVKRRAAEAELYLAGE